MRILFINRSYWPDVEATGQLLTELCEDLADHFEVHVLCGQPVENKGGDTFQQQGTEVRHGVHIHRVRHTRFPKGSFFGRVSNMVTFLFFATWTALTVPCPAIVITETDPPLLCLLGRLLQIIRRARLVCYLQDIYPDVAIALGKLRPGMVSRGLRWVFFGIYRRADAVVVLSRDMRQLLLRDGIAEQRLHQIANWMDSHTVVPIERSENRFLQRRPAPTGGWGSDVDLTDKFVVMYSGNMGLTQRLEDLLAAAEAIRETHPKIQIVLVGNGAMRATIEQLAMARDLGNMSFFDYVPKESLSHSLNAGDIHLILLDPRITRFLMPSKLYGILAAARPMLVLAPPDCELAEVCLSERLGWVVSPGDIAGVVSAIVEAWDLAQVAQPAALSRGHADLEQSTFCIPSGRCELDIMGQRGRQVLLREYDRRIATRRFRDLLLTLAPAIASPTAS